LPARDAGTGVGCCGDRCREGRPHPQGERGRPSLPRWVVGTHSVVANCGTGYVVNGGFILDPDTQAEVTAEYNGNPHTWVVTYRFVNAPPQTGEVTAFASCTT